MIVEMAVIHISESEAARDFAGVLARVRAGAEVVIESDAAPVAIVRSAIPAGPGRMLSELIAAAESRGASARLDGEFAHDLEAAVAAHLEPLEPPSLD